MNTNGIEIQKKKRKEKNKKKKKKKKRKEKKKESLLQDLEDKQFTLLFKEKTIQ